MNSSSSVKNWVLVNEPLPHSLSEVKELLLKTRDLTAADFELSSTLDSSKVLSPADLAAAAQKINYSISTNLPIIIHGDYDVDGLSGTTILWETIYRGLKYEKCRPFIPNRFDMGYGLSIESVEECQKIRDQLGGQKGLLIAVDCGITALKAVAHANDLGFEVLIIDHHQPLEKNPAAQLLWSDKLCAAGISYFLSQALVSGFSGLDLAAMATISDMQIPTGVNRQLVKQGLPLLSNPRRQGIKALKEVAGLLAKPVGVYEVGWFLSPRLNASGRLEDALDSLRLLCSLNEAQARELAQKLSQINSERQQKTVEMVEHAEEVLQSREHQKIIIAAHESYHEGVIGLVAGKLAQKYHRPAVVISRGPEFSKGSARSINGFNIVEALRGQTSILENVGGHPAAAGFTIKTERLTEFTQALQAFGDRSLDEETLRPTLKIDVNLPFELLGWELLNLVTEFEPFGIGNPEPVFLTRGLEIVSLRSLGAEGKHLSLTFKNNLRAVGFGLGEWQNKLRIGDRVDAVYSLVKNEWKGNVSLELRIKDLHSAIPE